MSDIELSRVGSEKVSATPPRAPGAPEPISRGLPRHPVTRDHGVSLSLECS